MSDRLLFIDTETGGLDPLRCSLLSAGFVVWENGSIVASTEVFVAESALNVDAEAQRIHGIDLEWLRSHGLSPAAAIDRIEAFLAEHFSPIVVANGVPIAGHNVGFDIGFLKRLYRLANRDYEQTFSHRTIDTAAILRFLTIAGLLTLDGAGSSAAFDYFGIAFGDRARHSALGDAYATALLFTKLLDVVRATRATDARVALAETPA